jgi:hypothetical protein
MIAQLTIVAAGVLLMAAPALFDYGGLAARHGRLLGPIIAAVAAVALSQATRSLRWCNLPCGLALVFLALGPGYPARASLVSIAAGGIVVLLTPMAPPQRHPLGGGWRSVWHSDKRASADGSPRRNPS